MGVHAYSLVLIIGACLLHVIPSISATDWKTLSNLLENIRQLDDADGGNDFEERNTRALHADTGRHKEQKRGHEPLSATPEDKSSLAGAGEGLGTDSRRRPSDPRRREVHTPVSRDEKDDTPTLDKKTKHEKKRESEDEHATDGGHRQKRQTTSKIHILQTNLKRVKGRDSDGTSDTGFDDDNHVDAGLDRRLQDNLEIVDSEDEAIKRVFSSSDERTQQLKSQYEGWKESAKFPAALTLEQWLWFYSVGYIGAPSKDHSNDYYIDNTKPYDTDRYAPQNRQKRSDEKNGETRRQTSRSQDTDEPKSRKKRQIVSGPMRRRREWRQLTAVEQAAVRNAMNSMKATTIGGASEYDIFVAMHQASDSPAAHGGQAFLPWHREFLWRFERALQQHDPNVMLPYWDSTLDQALPEPRDSNVWTSGHFGNNAGNVIAGLGAGWSFTNAVTPGCGGPLNRNAAAAPSATSFLMSATEANQIMDEDEFVDLGMFTGPSTANIEGMHGGTHVFVGGDMSSISCSPADPLFWMHHAFIDCLWEEFRRDHQVTPIEMEYPTSLSAGFIGGSNHEPFAPMLPFMGLVNIHGLSNHYTNYYYRCTHRPTMCYSWRECSDTHMLTCRDGVCVARIKVGGDCTGLVGVPFACHFGWCNPTTNRCTRWWIWPTLTAQQVNIRRTGFGN